MTLNSSGNVGIGISAPVSLLQLYKSNSAAVLGKNSDANLLIDSGDYGNSTYKGQISFVYYTGPFTYSPAAIAFIPTTGSGAGRGDLTFFTRDTTSDVAPTERMRITSGGIVQINSSMQTTISSKTVEYSNDGYGGYAYVYGAYGSTTPVGWPYSNWYPLLKRKWALVFSLVRGGGDNSGSNRGDYSYTEVRVVAVDAAV
jgi:hypothetical protein